MRGIFTGFWFRLKNSISDILQWTLSALGQKEITDGLQHGSKKVFVLLTQGSIPISGKIWANKNLPLGTWRTKIWRRNFKNDKIAVTA